MMFSNTQLKSRLFEVTEERDELRKELAELKEEMETIQSFHHERAVKTTQILNLRYRLKDSNGKLMEAKDEISYLKNFNADLKEILDSRSEQLYELAKENRELKSTTTQPKTALSKHTVDAVIEALNEHVDDTRYF